MSYYITAYCHIDNDTVRVNGETLVKRDNKSGKSWMRQLYKKLGMKYPKYFKMDLLNKTGVVGSELIKTKVPHIGEYDDDDIALVFANTHASTETDLRFRDSYAGEGSPSPSLFVYTLPNIVLGEISIKNSWYGENMFAIYSNFDPEYFCRECNIKLNLNAEACLGGWVDISPEGKIDAFVFFIEKKDRTGINTPFDQEQLINLKQ